MVKDATAKLDQETLARYGQLAREDVQSLAVNDKWGTTIHQRVQAEVTKLRQAFVLRLEVLGARYAATVPELDAELERLGAAVAAHLRALGVSV